ncbi:MAG: hypothetical protein LBS71_03040 [Puniceicoccales bacterium]|jgi:hypothetical protein|nr:hypothetical protein [Puniceicoccales bacterium]
MIWKLVYENGEKALAEWGISDMIRKLKNQSMDYVTFKIACNAVDAPLQFEPRNVVHIFRDEQLWFTGIVTKTPIYSSVMEEFHQYTLSGAWWYLENIIYQQIWKEPLNPNDDGSVLTDISKSHLILGQNLNGDAITIGEQLEDVIAYVNAAVGYDVINFGNDINLPIYIPFDECKDLSCAEVIRRLLRWIPDTITYFDYTQPVPVLHIVRRSQLSPLILDIHDLSEFNIVPRYDLQVQTVVLKFEKTHTNSGKSWKTVEIQRFPSNATGMELQSLVMTIELEGTQSTSIKQEVEATLIQISSEIWWRNHLPALNNVSNLEIQDSTRGGSLPNELISGTIANWMGCDVEQDIVTAKISYETDDEVVYNREVAVKINTTNAQSKTYRNLVSYVSEENVPANLAQNIYQSVSVLQYEGNIMYIQTEIDGTFLGRTINLRGGRPEWITMNAIVQSVEENLDKGAIRIILGPAKHLGPNDLSELTKSNRNRVSSRNFYARNTGEAGGNAYVEQGKYGRVENTSYGSGKLSKLSFCNPINTDRKIYIDTSELDSDVTVCLRQEDVSDSGMLRKRYTLASEPFVAISPEN